MDHGSNSLPGMSPPMSDNSMDMGMSMGMAMHMSFYWSKNAVVLFPGWPGRSVGMYILSLFFISLLAIAVEVLSVHEPPIKLASNPVLGALAPAVVHALRMGLAYMIMLAIMSFNLGIFIAAIVGHGIGLFLVKARASVVANRAGNVSSPHTVPKV